MTRFANIFSASNSRGFSQPISFISQKGGSLGFRFIAPTITWRIVVFGELLGWLRFYQGSENFNSLGGLWGDEVS